jgi:bifunctional non-homologous end joining protein LigD
MLATPWADPFSNDDWVFELKWDGVRCLLTSADGAVRLHSRAGNDMTLRYPEIAAGFYPADVVLDGEIVALDANGLPSFELLQGRMNPGRVPVGGNPVGVSFVVFDLLHQGRSLLQLPMEERRRVLANLDLPSSCVVAEQFRADSAPIWDFVTAHDLEGIVAKRIGSSYQPGVRSPDWRKIGYFKQVRAVVGGYTRGTGGRAATFGSLLLGLWTVEGLRWVGAVGSGFNDKALVAIRAALDEMSVALSPFLPNPEIPDDVIWVEPQLVTMVRFKQWTAAGRLRAPSFKGFTDSAASAATWEAEGPQRL